MTSTVEAEPKTEDDSTNFSVVKGLLKGALLGVVVICLAVIAATIAVPRIIGAVPLTVLSGSMVPTFNPGDLIITMPVDDPKEEIKRGDIVTFQPESGVGTLITHRVSSVGFSMGGSTVFTTKGDANSALDKPIIDEQVMGKYIYHVPYVGYVANAIPNDTKPVVIQALGVAILGWAFILFLMTIMGSRREKREKDERMIESIHDSPLDSQNSLPDERVNPNSNG